MSVNATSGSTAFTGATSTDSSAMDGIEAGVASYQAIYESVLKSVQKMLQPLVAQSMEYIGDSSMSAQSAAGALASYMHENSIHTVTPDQLYQLAYSPKAGTPTDVSDAAKFMLENPDTFNEIETHDWAGPDGIAGVNDFDWAAQGGLQKGGSTQSDLSASGTDPSFGDDSSMSAQSAAGALASYMHENSIHTVTP